MKENLRMKKILLDFENDESFNNFSLKLKYEKMVIEEDSKQNDLNESFLNIIDEEEKNINNYEFCSDKEINMFIFIFNIFLNKLL